MLLWVFLLAIPKTFIIVWCYELFFMRQLIRYCFVGVISNLTIYFIYLIITHLGVEPKKAMTLVYVIGATIGFIGNRKWTFAHLGSFSAAFLRYVVAHLCGYLLNFLILFTFVDRLGYAHQWVQAAAIIIVAGFLFIIFKYFVFSVNK
jgi:putative flippase GtrA